jgi:uncharacterized membrane protein YfcA
MSERVPVWAGAIDRAGVVASAACFLHCLLTPIVISLTSVYAHFLPAEEPVHRVLAVLVAMIGALSLLVGFRKHKRWSVVMLMAAGLLAISVGAFYGDRLGAHWVEVLVTLSGSLCLICAHRRNHTFCRSCQDCCSDL